MKKYFRFGKQIVSGHRKKKGVGLLAITMIFVVVLSLLTLMAIITATNTKVINTISCEGDQAANIALAGIDRVIWMINQDYQGNLNMGDVDYINAALVESSGNYLLQDSASSATSVTYPLDVPMGTYKVRITNCISSPNVIDGFPGREITIEAMGKVGETVRKVTKVVHFYEGANQLFNRAILGDDIPGCMFCHLNVYGDIGSMGNKEFVIWDDDHSSEVHGDFDTAGTFNKTKDQFLNHTTHSTYPLGPAGKKLMFDGGNIVEDYRNHSDNVTNPLPEKMDAISNYKTYIQSKCTGKIEVSSPYQITPGELYSAYPYDPNDPLNPADPNDTNNRMDQRATVLDTDAQAGGTNYGITYNSGSGKYELSGIYDQSLLTSYDSAVTLYGTAANPIEITGKVYIDGDVVIKGYVTGNGVIYSSRNIYVVDDLIYVDPPAWSTSGGPYDTTKDQLGLAAEGNILIGNPFSKYQQPADHGWEGYVKSQFVDAPGSGDSAARWVFAECMSRGLGEDFHYNNHYAWDGLNNGDLRDVRSSPWTHEVDKTGLLPNGTDITDVGGVNLTHYHHSDNNNPSGSKFNARFDPNSAGWMSIQDWNDFTGYIERTGGSNRIMGRAYSYWNGSSWVTSPNSDPDGNSVNYGTGRYYTNTPDQVDALMYSEGAIAMAHYTMNKAPKIHGTIVSNDTNMLIGSGQDISIYFDDRMNGNFMGFPPTLQCDTQGYQIFPATSQEFDTY